jgi:hypothetical protein
MDNNGVSQCLRTGAVAGLFTGHFYITVDSPTVPYVSRGGNLSQCFVYEAVASLRNTYLGSYLLGPEHVRSVSLGAI